jgi:hypothetical protein
MATGTTYDFNLWGGVVKFSQDEVKYGQTFIYPGKNYTVYE